MFRSRVLFLTFLFLVCGTAAHPAEADALKEKALHRLQSVESVECDYTFFYNTTYVIPFPEKVHFKAQGDMVAYTIERSEEDVAKVNAALKKGPNPNLWVDRVVGESNVHGSIDRLLDSPDEVVFHTKGEGDFHFIASNELTPLLVLGKTSSFTYSTGTSSLIHMMQAPGKTFLEREADDIRLYVYPQPEIGKDGVPDSAHGAILHLQEDGYIRFIDYLYRPDGSFEEIASFARNGDAVHVYQHATQLVFEKPVDIDGFAFPTEATLTIWTMDEDKTDMKTLLEYVRLHNEEKIGLTEMHVHRAELTKYKEKSRQRIVIDPESIKLNRPTLTEKDFDIRPEHVDQLWDLSTDEVWEGDAHYDMNEIRAQRETEKDARLKANFRRQGDMTLFISVIIFLASSSLLTSIFLYKRRLNQNRKNVK